MNTKKFNRDYSYVSRLAERVKQSPHDLLLSNVSTRLRAIRDHWKDGSPTLSERADLLLKTPSDGLKPRIGGRALVSVRMRDGATIRIPCTVLSKSKLFNRYEVTPIGGTGKTVVSAVNVAFLD